MRDHLGRREQDKDANPGGPGLAGQGHAPSGDRGACRTDDLPRARPVTPDGHWAPASGRGRRYDWVTSQFGDLGLRLSVSILGPVVLSLVVLTGCRF